MVSKKVFLAPVRRLPSFSRPLIEASIAGLIVIQVCLQIDNRVGAMVVGAIVFSRVVGGLVSEIMRGFWIDE